MSKPCLEDGTMNADDAVTCAACGGGSFPSKPWTPAQLDRMAATMEAAARRDPSAADADAPADDGSAPRARTPRASKR